MLSDAVDVVFGKKLDVWGGDTHKSLAPKVIIPNLRCHCLFELFLRSVHWTCISSMPFPRPDQSLRQPVQAHLVEAAE